MDGKFIIYGLVDPRTQEVRYVGLSSHGKMRPERHALPSSLREHNHKTSWVKSLLGEGLTYSIRVLEEVQSKGELPAAEIRWIAHGRAQGWPLTNLTDGGDGHLGHSPTPEVRAKISATHQGMQYSDETKDKVGLASRGRRHTPETKARISTSAKNQKGYVRTGEYRARMSAAKTGMRHTDEAREKMSFSHRGCVVSEEHRAKLSAALKGRKPSAETLRKQSLAHRGHTASAETRAKMSAAHKGRTYAPRRRTNAPDPV